MERVERRGTPTCTETSRMPELRRLVSAALLTPEEDWRADLGRYLLDEVPR